MSSGSCLVAKLENFEPLCDADRELIAALEKDERAIRGRTHLRRSGMPYSELYALKKGWVYSYTILPDGRRQILQIHVPGDIVGLYDAPFDHASHDLEAAANSIVCPFPKAALDPIFRHSPTMTALLFTFAMIDQVVYLDRLRALGRLNAVDRVGHFLLTILARMRLTGEKEGARFEFPLTQTDVADATGLTNVSVSKASKELREEGLADWREGRVEILDEDALARRTSFSNRFDRIDVSWFPRP